MATIQLPPDFKEFLRLLTSNRVEYMVVGGYAVNHYGYTRATGDLDIWIATDPINADLVVKVLHEFGFANAKASDLQEPGRVIRMGVPPVRLEILTSASGVDFRECRARAIEEDWDGVLVPIIHRDDLIKNKRAAGRLKDLLDLEELT